MRRLWPDSFVEEVTLARHISTLRRALGDTPEDERYIETVPKRGYRFVASVLEAPDDPDPTLRAVSDTARLTKPPHAGARAVAVGAAAHRGASRCGSGADVLERLGSRRARTVGSQRGPAGDSSGS